MADIKTNWSYSALKNYEVCPKRHWHYDLAKDVKEPESAQLAAGNYLHKAFDARLSTGKALPLGMGMFESMLAAIVAAPGELHAEKRLAMTAQFQPTAYFADDVWLRSNIDAVKISTAGDQATVFDWKDGKVKDDTTQLQLMASMVFVHMPELKRVKTALVFVNQKHTIPAEFVREDVTEIWSEIMPRVNKMMRARQTETFPPTPGGLCRNYCVVRQCPHNGK